LLVARFVPQLPPDFDVLGECLPATCTCWPELFCMAWRAVGGGIVRLPRHSLERSPAGGALEASGMELSKLFHLHHSAPLDEVTTAVAGPKLPLRLAPLLAGGLHRLRRGPRRSRSSALRNVRGAASVVDACARELEGAGGDRAGKGEGSGATAATESGWSSKDPANSMTTTVPNVLCGPIFALATASVGARHTRGCSFLFWSQARMDACDEGSHAWSNAMHGR